MTEKKERFGLISNLQGQVDIVDYVESEEKNAICIYNDLGVLPYTSAPSLCDLLNQLNDEYEQLKKELEENKELIQFKEQVFNLINKKLEENERELNGVDTAMYYANKGTLNELKNELRE